MGDNVRTAGRIGKEYIQEVNGLCDRILWRGKIYPLKQIKGMTLYRIDPRDLMHLSVAKSEGYFATDCKDTIPPEALRSLRIVIDTLERAERIDLLRTPKKPVVVPSGALADEMNALHGERYGIDWVYAYCEDEESRCHGEKCTTTNGRNHSVECLFGHFSSYTGARNETPEVLEKLRKAYFDGYGAGRAYEHPPITEKQEPVAPDDTLSIEEKWTQYWKDKHDLLVAECERLKALSVANILLEVVPGDGSGLEIYAESVSDVEALISRLGEKAEEYDLLKPEYEKLKSGLPIREQFFCADCQDTGWLENREEGKYPCTCMTEAEPYQQLATELAQAKADRDKLAKAIRDAAVSAGICREGAALTGPHLLLLCIDMGIALSNRKAEDDDARIGRKQLSLQIMEVMVEATGEAFDLEIIDAHSPEVHTVRKTRDAVILRLGKIIKEVEGG